MMLASIAERQQLRGVYAAKLRFYFKYWGIFYENLQKKPVIPYIYQVTTRCKRPEMTE
jgi:hypothetical protein